MSLPSGWTTEKLRTVCDVLTDGTHHSPANNRSGDIPYITAKNIKWGGIDLNDLTYVSEDEHQSIYRRCPVKKGDVLLIKDGATAGIATINDLAEPFSMLSSVALIRPSEALNNKYLWYWIRSLEAQKSLLGAMNGSAIRRLTLTAIGSTSLQFPPLAEQRRIVVKLDALTARLAGARMELKRADILQRKIRLAFLSQVFARHINSPHEKLEYLCRIGTGSTPKRGDPRYYSGGTIAWVTSGAVNQRLVDKPTEFITDAAVKETNCKVFPAGSLLVALYGEGKTRGKIAKLGIAAATNQALAVLHSFEKRVDPQWISLFLEARYQETRDEAAGGVQPNLNLGIIKAISLPIPPLYEQRAAIDKANLAFVRADRLEAEVVRARALLDRLESAILAKAFKGELVPQDPNDEPASVLLERIRAQRSAPTQAKHKPRAGRRITV